MSKSDAIRISQIHHLGAGDMQVKVCFGAGEEKKDLTWHELGHKAKESRTCPKSYP